MLRRHTTPATVMLTPGTPTTSLAESLRDTLLSARNPDGGWGYAAGKRSRLEPTASACLALGLGAELDAVLAGWRTREGVIVEPGIGEPNYTANAMAALAGLSVSSRRVSEWVIALLAALARVEGRKTGRADPAINRQDNELKGWPWVDGTFSWVEPTAWCVLALKRGLRYADERPIRARVDEGERLLLDRVCEPAGWNYGNSNVLRRNLPPYTPTTAVALLALQQCEAPAVQKSLTFLQAHRLSEASGLALALTMLCLGIYGRLEPDVFPALERQWQRSRFLGNLNVVALALCACGVNASPAEAFRV